MKHGNSAYKYHGCRCGICRAVKAEYARRWRVAVADQPIPDNAHGRLSTYKNYSCRCDACRQAMSDYQRRYQAAKRGDQ